MVPPPCKSSSLFLCCIQPSRCPLSACENERQVPAQGGGWRSTVGMHFSHNREKSFPPFSWMEFHSELQSWRSWGGRGVHLGGWGNLADSKLQSVGKCSNPNTEHAWNCFALQINSYCISIAFFLFQQIPDQSLLHINCFFSFLTNSRSILIAYQLVFRKKKPRMQCNWGWVWRGFEINNRKKTVLVSSLFLKFNMFVCHAMYWKEFIIITTPCEFNPRKWAVGGPSPLLP